MNDRTAEDSRPMLRLSGEIGQFQFQGKGLQYCWPDLVGTAVTVLILGTGLSRVEHDYWLLLLLLLLWWW